MWVIEIQHLGEWVTWVKCQSKTEAEELLDWWEVRCGNPLRVSYVSMPADQSASEKERVA